MNELETALQSEFIKMTDGQLSTRRAEVAEAKREYDMATTKTEAARRRLEEAEAEETRAMRAYHEIANLWIRDA